MSFELRKPGSSFLTGHTAAPSDSKSASQSAPAVEGNTRENSPSLSGLSGLNERRQATRATPDDAAAPGKGKGGMRAQLSRIKSQMQTGAYKHGFGISQTSKSITPFHTITSSARPKMQSVVRNEGQDAPPVPRTLAAQMADAALAGARPEAKPSGALAKLDSPAELSRVLDRHFQGTPAEKQRLSATFGEIRETAQLSHAETAVLAKSLALTFPSADKAVDAVSGLRDLHVIDDILHPSPDFQRASPANKMGWQFAAKLASVDGGLGLSLLHKVTSHGEGGDGRPAALTEAQGGRVLAYLRAASEVARASGSDRVDPAAIYGQGAIATAVRAARGTGDAEAWPGRAGTATPAGVTLTLAEKALLALHDELDPAVTQQHGCAFAVQMVRGGMVTDARRNADGTPSEFHRVESRAAKSCGKHVDRALRSGGSGASNMLTSLLKRFGLHQGKSPYHAYNAVISPDGRNVGFGLSHKGGIHEGRAVKDMIDVLEDALKQSGGPGRRPLLDADGKTATSSPDDATLRGVVRLALLQAVKANTVLLPRYARGDEPTPQMRDAARAGALGMIRQEASGSAVTGDALAQRVATMLDEEGRRMTPAALLQWAGDAGGPADEAAMAAHAGKPSGTAQKGQPDWTMFAQGYGLAAHNALPGVDTPSMKGATREDVAKVLSDMVRGEELGSGFSMTNGGFTQGTTRGVSEIISGILTAGTGSVRIDLGGGRKRYVTFESGVGTDRSYLRMGVATVKQGQGGAGGSIGPRLAATEEFKVSASAGADLQQAYEDVHYEGAVFGFPRHLSGGVGGDRDLAEQKAKLVALLLDVAGGGNAGNDGSGALPRPGNKEDQGSLVKSAYQAFGDRISVGRFEITGPTHTTTGSVNGGVGLTAGQFSVGPNLRLSGQMKIGATNYRDLSGTLQTVKTADAHTFKASVDGTVATFSGLVTDHLAQATAGAATHAIGEHVSAFSQLVAGRVGAGSADFFKCGETRATNRILVDGKQLPTSCAVTTYNDPASFVGALSADFQGFADDKSKKFFGARHAKTPDASVATEKQVLGEFAGEVLAQRDLTAAPQLYWEWGAHVDTVNLLSADVSLSRQLNDTPRVAEAERDMHRIHHDPAYREGRFIINSNVRSTSDTKGLNGLLGMTHNVENRVSEQSLRFS
ncbi:MULTISPECIES: hypothetical protein [Pandoraea]|uniref:hypothetical protein n=1 Tax=Pandoraea TaxID=93217 RepID=UPI001F5C6357|nr:MULTISPECIES: hypothetical protein [Pandoraea]MCI3208104.1 hypothetical protein [Pandoraea sp. LA3]MDN4586133.1 hypothetical protein [Pandoraea capi]